MLPDFNPSKLVYTVAVTDKWELVLHFTPSFYPFGVKYGLSIMTPRLAYVRSFYQPEGNQFSM